jgi:hypothetical protein
MSEVTQERARASKDHLNQVLREFDEVNGIGICKTGTGWALKVLLKRPITDGITPAKVNGVPVVYDVVGEITPA